MENIILTMRYVLNSLRNKFIPKKNELVIVDDTKELIIGDGETIGGHDLKIQSKNIIGDILTQEDIQDVVKTDDLGALATQDTIDLSSPAIINKKLSHLVNDTGFIDASVTDDLQEQIDDKIEYFIQDTDPAVSWNTTELKAKHVDDVWYFKSQKKTYYYDYINNTYVWVRFESQELLDVLDLAESKATIYGGSTPPTTGMKNNDLWVNEETAETFKYLNGQWGLASNLTTLTSQLIDDAELSKKADWDSVTGDNKPANNADVTAQQITILNTNFEQGRKYWAHSYTGKIVEDSTRGTILAGGIYGGSVWQLSGIQGVYSSNVIAVNTSKVYKGRFRVKQTINPTSGNSLVYAGVVTLDKNYNNLTGGSGTHRYFIVAGRRITSNEGWLEFEGTITGEGDSSNQFRQGTAYIRLMFIVNYQSGNGTVQVDSVEFFEDVISSNNIQKGATANRTDSATDTAINSAKNTAITTASADATTKANNAEQNAKAYANLSSIDWNLSSSNLVIENSGKKIRRKDTGVSWDKRAYAVSFTRGSAYIRFTASKHSTYRFMMGLTTDPTASTSYSTIDYTWYPYNGGANIYENGSNRSNHGTYTADITLFEIIYNGKYIIYKLDGVIKRKISVASNLKLYLTSCFLGQSYASNIAFGSAISADMLIGSTLQSANYSTTAGSQFDLDNGTFKLGGSSNPALSWDGTKLKVAGDMQINSYIGDDETTVYTKNVSLTKLTTTTGDVEVTQSFLGWGKIPDSVSVVGDRGKWVGSYFAQQFVLPTGQNVRYNSYAAYFNGSVKIVDDSPFGNGLEVLGGISEDGVKLENKYISKKETINSWETASLRNGWINYYNGYSPARFVKDETGRVQLDGMIRSGNVGYIAFVLPVKYRPAYRKIFIVYTAGTHGRVDIDANGAVIMTAVNSGYVSLSSISFLAEQ